MSPVHALLLASAGLVLLINRLQWRLRTKPVTATLVGVQAVGRGGMLAPVYQYTDASGRSVQAVCRTGSDDLRRLRTGRSVGLRVATDDPHAVREANDFILEFLGAALLAGGIWRLGLAHGPVLLRSLPVVAGVGVVYAA
ncbi:MAG TPA: DUF3592 domain-containing protein, partial [Burkholderiaceae bacterium]|nr:DUF3592 domain-containing protein [Burkholderiaceae bacterium]